VVGEGGVENRAEMRRSPSDLPAEPVDRPVLRGGHEPGARVVRDPRLRPPLWRGWRPAKGIAALYDELAGLARSPVVELNRAVAHAMAFGPSAGPR
jgi:hypothetical protein